MPSCLTSSEGSPPNDCVFLLRLKTDAAEWNSAVTRAREQYYFLNHYTMRELIRLISLLDQVTTQKAGLKKPKSVFAKQLEKDAQPPPLPPSDDKPTTPTPDADKDKDQDKDKGKANTAVSGPPHSSVEFF